VCVFSYVVNILNVSTIFSVFLLFSFCAVI